MSIQIEPLTLKHQELLESRFRVLNIFLSEYTFANLYLFRKLHNYEVLSIDEELFIRGITRDGIPFIMLTMHPLQYSVDLFNKALLYAKVLFPIPEEWLKYFDHFLKQASFKDEESDYLFTRDKLALFPGRHLSKKRNLVTQLKSHELRAENLMEQKAQALEILQNWWEEHGEEQSTTDFNSCAEAIENLQQLHLEGRIITVDNHPAGFTIGEKVADDCFAVHFCKGMKSIKGLFQFLYQDLANSQAKTYTWINLEQDLGIPTIREAKHSYAPDKYLLKWRVELN